MKNLQKALLIILISTKCISQNNADIDNTFILDDSINYGEILYQEGDEIYIKGGGEILKIKPDGSIDDSFNTISIGTIYSLDKQSDGKIIIFHNSPTFNDIPVNQVIRLNLDWTLDNSFNCNINIGTIRTVKVQKDDKILYGGRNTGNFGRLNSDGTIDNQFESNIGSNFYRESPSYAELSTIKIDESGKILIGGRYELFNGNISGSITRLNNDGTIDSSFNPSGIGFVLDSGWDAVLDIEILKDGKILVGGDFSAYNGITISALIRLNSDGSIDRSFTPYINNEVYEIEIQSDDKIVIGGSFTVVGGLSINRLCRLNSNGSKDISFDILTGFDETVREIEITSNNKILIQGYFNTYQGASVNTIIQLNGNSTLSTDNYQKKDFKFYPNPAKEFITLSVNDNIEYEIFNIIGEKVLEGKSCDESINISILTNGVYFLILKNDKTQIKYKLLKN